MTTALFGIGPPGVNGYPSLFETRVPWPIRVDLPAPATRRARHLPVGRP
jgi:hypothetical protein